MKPLVTVIVASYNYSRYIEATLDSIRAQTYRPIQLIIVDDGSSDDSVAVIRRWLARERIEADLILHESNRGVSAVLNSALARATGAYVATLGSDDLWAAHRLEAYVQRMSAGPEEYGVVYGEFCQIDEHGALLPDGGPAKHPEGRIYRELIHGCFIAPMATLIRRTCFETVGAFDESLPFEDWDMFLRLARDYTFAFCPGRSTYRRRHRESYSARHRGGGRWAEAAIAVNLKNLGVDAVCDPLIKGRVVQLLATLYVLGDPRYDGCFAAASERFRHPMLRALSVARVLRLPPAVVRAAGRTWRRVCGTRRARQVA